jgi:hypothetical protein
MASNGGGRLGVVDDDRGSASSPAQYVITCTTTSPSRKRRAHSFAVSVICIRCARAVIRVAAPSVTVRLVPIARPLSGPCRMAAAS